MQICSLLFTRMNQQPGPYMQALLIGQSRAGKHNRKYIIPSSRAELVGPRQIMTTSATAHKDPFAGKCIGCLCWHRRVTALYFLGECGISFCNDRHSFFMAGNEQGNNGDTYYECPFHRADLKWCDYDPCHLKKV